VQGRDPVPGVHVEAELHQQPHRRRPADLDRRQHRIGSPRPSPVDDAGVGRARVLRRRSVARQARYEERVAVGDGGRMGSRRSQQARIDLMLALGAGVSDGELRALFSS